MRRILLTLLTVFFMAACSPTTDQTDEGRDHMMDDDIMQDEEHMMEDEQDMMDREKTDEDDSLRNRDMMTSLSQKSKTRKS